MSIPAIDIELKKMRARHCSDVNWELISTTDDKEIPGVKSAATFRFRNSRRRARDLSSTTPSSKSAATSGAELAEARESEPKPVRRSGSRSKFRTTAKKHESVEYICCKGRSGLPLENAENTSKFRDLKLGFLNDDGTLHTSSKRADALVKEQANGELEEWRTPFKYVGVDVQYFAAVVIPVENQLKNQYIEIVKPLLLDTP